MAKWDISGEWLGEYAFNHHPAYPVHPPPTAFTFSARLGWFGRFRGMSMDDPSTGPPEPASITGRITGTHVMFFKQYPCYYIHRGDRLMTLREHLQSDFGLVLDRDVPSDPIRYTGDFDPEQQVITGDWHMFPSRLRFVCGGRPLEAETSAVSGTWSMRRRPSAK
jgi:hypothetical protein